MKTSLRLNADQEKLWGPFESVVKDGAKARVIALQKEQSEYVADGPLEATADRVAQGTANLKTIAEAAKPLYASLNDAQKHKFITLGRMLVPERGRFATEMRHLRMGESDENGARVVPGRVSLGEAKTRPISPRPRFLFVAGGEPCGASPLAPGPASALR